MEFEENIDYLLSQLNKITSINSEIIILSSKMHSTIKSKIELSFNNIIWDFTLNKHLKKYCFYKNYQSPLLDQYCGIKIPILSRFVIIRAIKENPCNVFNNTLEPIS